MKRILHETGVTRLRAWPEICDGEGMSQPRRVIPGQAHLLTRRCAGRSFLLSRGAEFRDLLLYCLAYSAKMHGILVHGYSFLSNHYHLAITDPRGELPQFMARFNGLVARAGNRHWNRGENFWAPGSYSNVELSDQATFLKKLSYTLCNAVKHGLVRTPKAWKGLKSLPSDIGCQVRVKRPEKFFRQEEGLPEELTLTLTKPPLFADLSEEDYRDRAQRLVESETRRFREERKRAGKRQALCREDLLKSACPERSPSGTSPRRGKIKPVVACPGDPKRYATLKKGLKAWRQAYRQAWAQWKQGVRDALFPLGTFWMRLAHKAPCYDPSPS